MIVRRSIVVVSLLAALPAMAGDLTYGEKTRREIPMYIGGTFILENTAGDIDVVGTDESKVVLVAEKIVRGPDKSAVDEGREQTQIAVGGDARMRRVRTLVPNLRNGWVSGINYTVRVPRTVQLKITSLAASHIHVSGMVSNVSIKGTTGVVTIDDVTGPVFVETANGNVVFNAPAKGMADAQLVSINGNVEARAPAATKLQWIALVVAGEARTTFPVTPSLIGDRFVANVNGGGSPTIVTQSFNGNVALLQNGTQYAAGRAVRPPMASSSPSIQPDQNLERQTINGFLRWYVSRGNIIVGQIHGAAEIGTGAGEIQLGTVFGPCQIKSGGGPLTLGQIIGELFAKTEAGDVNVETINHGGTIQTGGGIIRLNSATGSTRLTSGGGDIVVRRADGPISAETQSGDISITLEPSSKTEKVTAKTAKGNVVLYVGPAFSAEIDATVITSDPDTNRILSDLPGLSFRREQIGGKTKIRATGKVNGGGGRIELYAEDGGIQITVRSGPAASIQP
jgi:DUF4097 and DUF4098 domain-containing protein YvlB